MTSFFKIIILLFIGINLQAQTFNQYKILKDTTLFSTHLGYNKEFSILLPKEWQSNLPTDFPLLIVFDRQRERNTEYILQTIDQLTYKEQMPSSVVICLHSDKDKRTLETNFNAPNNNGKKHEQFLFKELIPWAKQTLHTSSFLGLIGHSRHGFFTTKLLTSKIQNLNAIISFSPFLNQGIIHLSDSISQLENTTLHSTKYYQYVIGNDNPQVYFKLDSIFSNMVNSKVKANGYFFEYADHYSVPSLGIAQSLYNVFAFWAKEQNNFLQSHEYSRSLFQQKIKSHYGNPINPSLYILNEKAWQAYKSLKYEDAIQTWNYLIELYPNFSEAHLYIIKAKLKLKQPISNTINSFKNSLKHSQLYSEFKKLELLEEIKNL